MKKLLFLVLIVFVFSCKKESCYVCTLTYLTTTSGIYASKTEKSSSTVSKCDMSEKEIDNLINESTTVTTATVSGVTVTIRTSCTCLKQ